MAWCKAAPWIANVVSLRYQAIYNHSIDCTDPSLPRRRVLNTCATLFRNDKQTWGSWYFSRDGNYTFVRWSCFGAGNYYSGENSSILDQSPGGLKCYGIKSENQIHWNLKWSSNILYCVIYHIIILYFCGLFPWALYIVSIAYLLMTKMSKSWRQCSSFGSFIFIFQNILSYLNAFTWKETWIISLFIMSVFAEKTIVYVMVHCLSYEARQYIRDDSGYGFS